MKYNSQQCLELLKSNKLILICDLDETLLSSVFLNFDRLKLLNIDNLDVTYSLLDREYDNYVHTKIRPHLAQFLTEMSQYFEMHIMSFGGRHYVERMMSLIDPDKRLFGDRLICREDIKDKNKRITLEAMFPDGDNIVCAIDDRKDVWHSYPNLICVRGYNVLHKVRKQITKDKDLLQEETIKSVKDCFLSPNDDNDNYLKRLAQLLTYMHDIYFKRLGEMRNCNIEEINDIRGLPNIKSII